MSMTVAGMKEFDWNAFEQCLMLFFKSLLVMSFFLLNPFAVQNIHHHIGPSTILHWQKTQRTTLKAPNQDSLVVFTNLGFLNDVAALSHPVDDLVWCYQYIAVPSVHGFTAGLN